MPIKSAQGIMLERAEMLAYDSNGKKHPAPSQGHMRVKETRTRNTPEDAVGERECFTLAWSRLTAEEQHAWELRHLQFGVREVTLRIPSDELGDKVKTGWALKRMLTPLVAEVVQTYPDWLTHRQIGEILRKSEDQVQRLLKSAKRKLGGR